MSDTGWRIGEERHDAGFIKIAYIARHPNGDRLEVRGMGRDEEIDLALHVGGYAVHALLYPAPEAAATWELSLVSVNPMPPPGEKLTLQARLVDAIGAALPLLKKAFLGASSIVEIRGFR